MKNIPATMCTNIHSRFEFCTICATKCCQRIKKQLNTWQFRVLKIERYTKGQRVFTVQLLQESFPGSIISRFSDQNSPRRSGYLTPLDFNVCLFFILRLMPTEPRPTTHSWRKFSGIVHQRNAAEFMQNGKGIFQEKWSALFKYFRRVSKSK